MYLALALESLCAIACSFETYLCLSALDGDIAIGLDTLWRNTSLRVFLTLACGDDADYSIVDVYLIVAVDALASDAGRLDVEFTTIDIHDAVGLDA